MSHEDGCLAGKREDVTRGSCGERRRDRRAVRFVESSAPFGMRIVRVVRSFVAEHPFLTVGLIGWAMLVLGQEPAGFDYDPNPVRQLLRLLGPIPGFFFFIPGFMIAYWGHSTGARPFFLASAIGFGMYVLADVILKRRRRAQGAASRTPNTF
jgi:hypothetical protein